METNIYDELKWRGLIYDSIEGVEKLTKTEKVTLYNGFDSTADSLHVGHLVPLIALARFQRMGHNVLALAGGGTSMIGDPSGRSTERNLLSFDEVQHNVECIKKQLAHFLDFDVKSNPAEIVNNNEWLKDLNVLEFLRDIGKFFSVNTMMTKDSVKTRLERENGLSYTEFSYMLLQSYDFMHLYETKNCKLQTGGSDQWGNIVAGTDLIRRKLNGEAFGLTYPLIKKSDGTKFGKTASGAVWLDAKRTSPYKFYQFWLNTDDADVINYLKYFTFFDQDKIAELQNAMTEHPESREAQKALANDLTLLMHGQTGLDSAVQASQALFGGEIDGLKADQIAEIFADVPSYEIEKEKISGGIGTADLIAESGFMKSKGEVRRSIQEGGLYVDNHRVTDIASQVTLDNFIEGKFLVIRKGKKNYFLIKVKTN